MTSDDSGSITIRRALFVHSANEMYGADTILLSLLRGCPARWRPQVVLPNDVPYEGRLSRALQECGIPWREMKLAVLRRRYLTHRFPLYCAYFARSTAALVETIRREKIDVVHSNTTAVIPGAVAARLTRTPHVWHSHEMVISPGALRRLTSRLAPALSDVVLTVSGAVRDHILETNPRASNIRVLHNGIDVERFATADGRERVRAEFGFKADDIVCVTLARVSRGKGQTFLMDAAALAQQKCPHLRYLLVGDAFVGQEHLVDELRAHMEALGLSGKAAITGYRQDAPDLLAASDICVLPSTLPDSFPTVVLEGMASGKPLIATDWGGAREMIVDTETGYLVPVNDTRILADRLERLAGSDELRETMGQAGQRRARELFTRERLVQEFWSIMDETAGLRPGVPAQS